MFKFILTVVASALLGVSLMFLGLQFPEFWELDLSVREMWEVWTDPHSLIWSGVMVSALCILWGVNLAE